MKKSIDKPTNKGSIKELFKNYKGDYKSKKIDWGKPIGKEKI